MRVCPIHEELFKKNKYTKRLTINSFYKPRRYLIQSIGFTFNSRESCLTFKC